MHYCITLMPARGLKMEEFVTRGHVDTYLALLRAIGEKRRAVVEVPLQDGTRAVVGRTIKPKDNGKPWMIALMVPRMIQGLIPAWRRS